MTRSLLHPQGVLPYQEMGGWDLTSSLEAKLGARSIHVHQIRGKIWKFLLPQDTKVRENSEYWGHILNSEGKI